MKMTYLDINCVLEHDEKKKINIIRLSANN